MSGLIQRQKIRTMIYALIIVGLCAYLIFETAMPQTSAQSASPITELEGYAWSSTIGWVSLNCANTGTCADHSGDPADGYRVEIMDDMTLSGFGWSEHIGWVKFGGLSSCPGGSCDAVVNTTTNELEGWARACAGTDPGDCSTMANHPDGWDGWISLNCANTGGCGTSNYAIDIKTGGFLACDAVYQSCAWGDDVVGWVDLRYTTFVPPATPGYYACEHAPEERKHRNQWGINDYDTPCDPGEVCSEVAGYTCKVPVTPSVDSFEANPDIIRSMDTTNITWSVQDASDCRVVGGKDSWTGTSSTQTTSQLRTITQYSLHCTSIDGGSEMKLGELNVHVVPNAAEI